MTMLHNPYMAQNLSISMLLDEYVDLMEENSPMNSENTPKSTTMPENQSPTSQNSQASDEKEVINIEEEDEPLPPLSTAPSWKRHYRMMIAHLSSGPLCASQSQRNWSTQWPPCLNTWNHS